MPGGDRTGPMGMGPMSGRAAGFCAGFGTPGYENPVSGRGFRMGLGRGRGFGGGGRGWRHWFQATGMPGWMRSGVFSGPYPKSDPEMEKQTLRSQAEALQSELDFVKKRLDEIETGTAAE